MARILKGLKNLTASRTGLPSVNDYDEFELPDSRRGAWIAILALAIAFALSLQMEAESIRSANEEMAGWMTVNR